ncbi:MAG: BMC domain-containing protein [Desulfobacterales bacterium]|nr:BMC domain-containing protein [Desulfobacterales bacterium]
MNGKALGIIETIGLVPAIEAADTAVKSAEVELLEYQFLGAGLVSILMTGDVSSVNASVEAGKVAAERLGTVHSVTVIAKTADGLEDILKESSELSDIEPEMVEQTESEVIEEETGLIDEKSEIDKQDSEGKKDSGKGIQSESSRYEISKLKKMSVSKLRQIARTFEGFSVARKKINVTRKKELIEAIKKAYRDKEE